METREITAGYVLRLIGLFGIAVGAAWAVQTIGFGHEALGTKLTWAMAAAAMSGAGAGLVVAASSVEPDRQPVRA